MVGQWQLLSINCVTFVEGILMGNKVGQFDLSGNWDPDMPHLSPLVMCFLTSSWLMFGRWIASVGTRNDRVLSTHHDFSCTTVDGNLVKIGG